MLTAIVVVGAAVRALDEYLDDVEQLRVLQPDELSAAWRAAGTVSRDADSIYNKLRRAMTAGIITSPAGTT